MASLGIDRGWRKQLVRACALGPDSRVLDLCSGTGDVAFALAEQGRPAEVVATDFVPEMLAVAEKKAAERRTETPVFFSVADAQDLPFPDESFDVVTVAFGVRNLPERERNFTEVLRVLKPGGRYVILEFSTPGFAPWRAVYHVYLRQAIPAIGGVLTGDRAGFVYLNDSIRQFPDAAAARRRAARGGLQRRSPGRTSPAASWRCTPRSSSRLRGRDGSEPAAAVESARYLTTGGASMLLTARYVLPVAAPHIEYGAVLVKGDQIVEIGDFEHLRAPAPRRAGPRLRSRRAHAGLRRPAHAPRVHRDARPRRRPAVLGVEAPAHAEGAALLDARTGTTRRCSARSRRSSPASPPSPTSPRPAPRAMRRRPAGLRAHVYREVATMEKHDGRTR